MSLGGTPLTAARELLKGYLAAGVELAKRTPSQGLTRLWTTGTSTELQGDAALAPYLELAAQLAGVPGKKAVVLFRSDIRLDRQGLDERSTQRRRQNRRAALGADIARSDQTLNRLQTVALFSRTSFYPAYSGQAGSMNQQGLNRIAQATNGRPLLGTGDLKLIFGLLLEDARDYYVLGYSPDLRGNGAAAAGQGVGGRQGCESEGREELSRPERTGKRVGARSVAAGNSHRPGRLCRSRSPTCLSGAMTASR